MRLIFVASVPIFVLAFAFDNVAYSDAPAEHCGIGDVAAISQAAPQGYTQLAMGHPLTGLPESILRCQSRLYDDNGPDVPHVWCEHDTFLLGILIFDSYKLLGLDRNTAATFLKQFAQTVVWTSPTGSIELEITRTAMKDKSGPVFGHLIYFHDYTILGQPDLQPGDYTWEWTGKHPFWIEPGNPEGIVVNFFGEVEIVSHGEHLSRVDAGTW